MDNADIEFPAIRLLGTPVAHDAGGEHPLAPLRRNQLAAYLACRADWVTRGELAGLFWEDQEQAEGRRNLRRMLHDLRREPWLREFECRGDALRWRPVTDLAAFTALCVAGRWGDAARVGARRLLAGFEAGATDAFHDWLQCEREHQAARWRSAVAKHRAALRADAEARAVLARHVLAHDPHDEDAVADLVEALRARGREAEAREASRAFADRLERDLGIEARVRLSPALP